MIQDVEWEKCFIRETVEYEKVVQRVFALDRHGPSGDRTNSPLLVSKSGKKRAAYGFQMHGH